MDGLYTVHRGRCMPMLRRDNRRTHAVPHGASYATDPQSNTSARAVDRVVRYHVGDMC